MFNEWKIEDSDGKLRAHSPIHVQTSQNSKSIPISLGEVSRSVVEFSKKE
jgi:hypothetical protein